MYIWKMAWQRKGKEAGKDRGIQSTMGKVRKRKEHIFKPMLIYLSSQSKQVHKGKKSSSLLRALSKSTLNSKIGDNKYRNANWTEKQWRLSLGRVLKWFGVCRGHSRASSCRVYCQAYPKCFCPGEGTCSGAGEITWIAQGTKGPQATRCRQGVMGEAEQRTTGDGGPFACRITKGLHNCVKWRNGKMNCHGQSTFLPEEGGEVDFKTMPQGNATRVVRTVYYPQGQTPQGKRESSSLPVYHFPPMVFKTPKPRLLQDWNLGRRVRKESKNRNDAEPIKPLYHFPRLPSQWVISRLIWIWD